MLILGESLFIAKDGTQFSDKDSCSEYDESVRELYYFEVQHNPDLHCDGTFQSKKLLVVKDLRFFEAELRAQEWVFENIGSPVAFLKGVKPLKSYIIRRVSDKSLNLSDGQMKYAIEDVVTLCQFQTVLDGHNLNSEL